MIETFNAEENAKNLYVIKHQLSGLTIKPRRSYFEYYVGRFYFKIVTLGEYINAEEAAADVITLHDKVVVYLYEERTIDDKLDQKKINTYHDDRFVHFKHPSPETWNGWNNAYSTTMVLTINELCELIRYIKRMENLLAFL